MENKTELLVNSINTINKIKNKSHIVKLENKTNYWHNDNQTIESEIDKKPIGKWFWVWDSKPENAIYLFVKYESLKKSRSFKYSCYNQQKQGFPLYFVGNFKNINKEKPW